jgi:hypothetical protein
VGPSLQQLMQQIARSQRIDIETYLAVFFYENANKDIGSCTICRARGGFHGEQHDPVCGHSSIMTLPNWVAVYRQREAEPRVGDE